MTYKLLIVDDEAANVRLLERLFREDYFCLTASSGGEAIELLDQHDVAVIITDQRMPGMTGIELLKRSADRRPHMVRILLTGYTDIEALVEAVNCGLVYTYVSKPWNNEDLKLRMARAVEHYENNKRQHSLEAANERLLLRVEEMKLSFVRSLASALRLRDEYSYAHGSRISKYANVIGQQLGLDNQLIADLTAAAFLHDLGVLGSSDKLAHAVYEHGAGLTRLQTHPERAAQILSFVPELMDVADIIRYQHENYDGTGYPVGLAGDEIPLTSRILRVACEYDLLTRPHTHGQPLSHTETLVALRKTTARLLDENLVQILANLPAGELSSLEELNAIPVRPELITYAIN